MIQELKIKNFLSFKEEATLNFEATKDTTFEEPQEPVCSVSHLFMVPTPAESRTCFMHSIICIAFGLQRKKIWTKQQSPYHSCLIQRLLANLQGSK